MSSDVTAVYPENTYIEQAQIAAAYGGGFTIPAAWTNAELNRVMVEKSQVIDSITGRYFGKVTRAEVLSGNGTPYMWLDAVTSLELLSISGIKFRETFRASYDWANGAVVEPDTYDITESGRCVVRVGGVTEGARYADGVAGEWVKGHKNYQITGVWGCEDIPVVIERCVLALVREAIQPGYLKRSEAFLRERWADGYEYERMGRFTSSIPQYTGYDAVDRLLHPFVSDDPELGFAVG